MKPWIEAIHAYVPGRSKAADGRALVKLSANENPLGTSPAALAARAEAVVPALYPDPDSHALREALAEVHRVELQGALRHLGEHGRAERLHAGDEG